MEILNEFYMVSLSAMQNFHIIGSISGSCMREYHIICQDFRQNIYAVMKPWFVSVGDDVASLWSQTVLVNIDICGKVAYDPGILFGGRAWFHCDIVTDSS